VAQSAKSGSQIFGADEYWWCWVAVGVLIGYTVLFNIILVWAHQHLGAPGGGQRAVVSEDQLLERQVPLDSSLAWVPFMGIAAQFWLRKPPPPPSGHTSLSNGTSANSWMCGKQGGGTPAGTRGLSCKEVQLLKRLTQGMRP